MASHLLRLLVALVVGALVFVALMFVGFGLGGTECDRGSCNWFGELISATGWLYPALSLLIGLSIGVGLAQPHARR